ncbi:MAG: MFS transporter, partial [Thermoplasmatota archaeon]
LSRERRAMGFVVQSVLKRVPLLVGVPFSGWLITTRLGIVDGVRVGLAGAALVTAFALFAQWRFYKAPTKTDAAAPAPFAFRDLSPALRRLLLSDILVRMGESATKAFVVIYVVTALGYTDYVFGIMVALQTAVTLAVYVPAARAADRGRRKPWVIVTFAFFTLFPLAVLGARSVPLLILAFAVAGLREIGEPARKASIVDMAGAESRGRAVGVYYAARGFAIMPIGILAGFLYAVNPTWAFVAGAALSGAGLVAYVIGVREE